MRETTVKSGGSSAVRAFAKGGTRKVAWPISTQGATGEAAGAPSKLAPSYGHA